MTHERPTFGSLFAGIGGIDLGLERAGWECRWQVEWDEFCQHVLAHHWPDVPRYGDITAVDWSGVERVDLIAGGFPCQPVSAAGKQLRQADDRWLWPEFARAVRHLRPRLVLVENVPGLLAGGMDEVLGDLAALGYDAEWQVISAADVGAPHLRERVWIVAHDDRGNRRASGSGEAQAGAAGHALDGGSSDATGGTVAHPNEPRLERRGGHRGEDGEGTDEWPAGACGVLADTDSIEYEGGSPAHERAAAADLSPDPDGQRWIGRSGEPRAGWWREPSDGSWWSSEPDVGRVAHGVPARVDRLRALGNAVVPQVVEVIGRQLLAALDSAA